jgi:hypothetical protein
MALFVGDDEHLQLRWRVCLRTALQIDERDA